MVKVLADTHTEANALGSVSAPAVRAAAKINVFIAALDNTIKSVNCPQVEAEVLDLGGEKK